jgi:hypothetical protein
MAPRKPPKNLLANRTASVAITRNGLAIEITGVAATDAGVVAKSLLDAMRDLVKAGYDELLPDGGSMHSTPIDQAEEADDPDYIVAPEARSTPPKLGFHQ